MSFTSSNTLGQYLSIHHLLKAQAEQRSEAIAIAAPGRKPLTYSRLLRQIDDAVKTLNSAGIGPNDRVAVVLPNGPEMAVAFLATTAAATCAPLNPAFGPNEFDFYLEDLNAKALIVQSGIDSPAIAVAQKRGIPILKASPASQEAGVFTLRTESPARRRSGAFPRQTDIALVLHTSGTTSRPKLVPLTQANIWTSAYNIVLALELTSRDCCLNVMPLFHIHGLMAILSSLAAGSSVVFNSTPNLSDFLDCMEEYHPTWYTASPTIHRIILAQGKRNRRVSRGCRLRFIRSSSSPLPLKIMAALETVFKAPVIESYSMTEASHQMSSNPLPPGKRKLGSVGVAAGPEVGVMDHLGNLLPRTNTGEIVVRGPNMMRGYENNPDANALSFTNGWFRTGDVGHLDEDGYLFITGRLKEIINRGGEKISPYEVEAVLMDHPAIVEAVVFPFPHPNLGEDIATAVVLKENVSLAETEIRRFAATKLADFKVPSRIAIVNQIPKSSTGKVQRIGLAEKIGFAAPDLSGLDGRRLIVPARNRLEFRLAQIWKEVLGLITVGVRDNFFDLGGYSLLAMNLITGLEKEFHCSIPLRILYEYPTIERLADYLRGGRATRTWSRLIPLQPAGSKPPFFLFHGEERLGRRIGVDRPVYELRPHGLDGQRAPSTVEALAADYLREIRTVQPEGPFYIGGYSFGGLVAFELAQQLTAQGQEVRLLVLLDPTPPTNCRTEPASGSPEAGMPKFTQRVRTHWRNLRLLSDRDKIAYVSKEISWRLDVIESAAKMLACQAFLVLGRRVPERFRSFYFLEISHRAAQNYVAKVYTLPVALLRTQERKSLSACWSRLSKGQTDTYDMLGGHLDVIRGPHVQAWAERVTACLRDADAKLTDNRSTTLVSRPANVSAS